MNAVMDQVFPGGLGGIGTKKFGAKSFSYTSYISNFFKRNFFMVMLLNIKKHGFEGTDPGSGNRGGKYCLFQMGINIRTSSSIICFVQSPDDNKR